MVISTFKLSLVELEKKYIQLNITQEFHFFLEFKISYVDFITSYMSIHFSMSGLIDANGPVKVTLNF
jgi:hypothetical protein